ncbi:MAG: hypothetical protein HQK55_10525, partial [Deltaproteobacteria bacterium]|nr:hypothetical protein [Deltaproteobacteria bacterium]
MQLWKEIPREYQKKFLNTILTSPLSSSPAAGGRQLFLIPDFIKNAFDDFLDHLVEPVLHALPTQVEGYAITAFSLDIQGTSENEARKAARHKFVRLEGMRESILEIMSNLRQVVAS